MGKKLSFEQVQDYFREQGCELLETEYSSSKKPMRYRCYCGNESTTSWDEVRENHRCGKCSANARKLSIDHVREQFAQAGCELLETEYTNCMTPLRYRCACGEESTVRWNDFKDGTRCMKCKGERSSEKMKASHWSRSGVYRPPMKRVKIACPVCRKEFEIPECRADTARFCSKKCKWEDSKIYHAEIKQLRKTVENLARQSIKLVRRTRKTSQFEEKNDLLGYSGKELYEHIHSHPNWINCKGTKWHLDHVFPIKSFLDYGIFDLKIINALDNLQPTLFEENISKGGHYIREHFEKWLRNKMFPGDNKIL